MGNSKIDDKEKFISIKEWLKEKLTYEANQEYLKRALFDLFNFNGKKFSEYELAELMKNSFDITEEEALNLIEEHVVDNVQCELGFGFS